MTSTTTNFQGVANANFGDDAFFRRGSAAGGAARIALMNEEEKKKGEEKKEGADDSASAKQLSNSKKAPHVQRMLSGIKRKNTLQDSKIVQYARQLDPATKERLRKVRDKNQVRKSVVEIGIEDIDNLASGEVVKPWYIIHPDAKWKMIWDYFIIFLVFYNAIFIPMNVAFNPISSYAMSLFLEVADYFVDIIFLCDMVMSFLSGHRDNKGNLVYDKKVIAIKYLKYWFHIEFLSIFPFESIAVAAGIVSSASPLTTECIADSLSLQCDNASAQSTALLGLLRLPRLLRLGRLMKRFDKTKGGNIIRLLQMIILFLLLVHWVACFWFLLGNSQVEGNIFSGLPWPREYDIVGAKCSELQWGNIDNPESAAYAPYAERCTQQNLTVYDKATMQYLTYDLGRNFSQPGLSTRRVDADFRTQYTTAMYWSMTTLTTVGYGDISPITSTERFFVMAMMLLGAVVYAFLFGNIGLLINKFDSEGHRYRDKMESINEFLKFHDIPSDLSNRVKACVDSYWNMTKGYDLSSTLSDLPVSLRGDVAMHMHEKMVAKAPLFEGCSRAFIQAIVLHLRPLAAIGREYIIKEGEAGRELFFLAKGKVEVVNSTGDVVYAVMGEGSFFGEIEPLLGGRRTASVRCLTQCNLYYLTKDDFIMILKDFPEYMSKIRDSAVVRAEELRLRREILAEQQGAGAQQKPAIPAPPTDEEVELNTMKKAVTKVEPADVGGGTDVADKQKEGREKKGRSADGLEESAVREEGKLEDMNGSGDLGRDDVHEVRMSGSRESLDEKGNSLAQEGRPQKLSDGREKGESSVPPPHSGSPEGKISVHLGELSKEEGAHTASTVKNRRTGSLISSNGDIMEKAQREQIGVKVEQLSKLHTQLSQQVADQLKRLEEKNKLILEKLGA
mmetsp:Transcript_47158/g.121868  ORF Transcript_47158/g.121868 Transcript_47158/m.121868 type:complete len:900 (-) Transcript_47158:497-3196(-)